jgi:hypothetical protein
MEKSQIIAIWLGGKCEIAPVTEDESMPSEGFVEIGISKQKQTTLEATEGESFELKGSGGSTVDIIETEGGFQLKTVVIKPTTLYKTLGLTEDEYDASGRMKVKTHVVEKRFAMRFTPKRVGAMGVEAPVTQVSFKPGGAEEEGDSAEVTFKFIHGAQDYWYERFKHTGAAASPDAQE